MRIKAHNTETFYQTIGKHPRTLLLLHGWGNNWEAWSPLIPELSKNYRLLIPDLPGFGGSDSPQNGWEMSEYVEWLRDFLKKTETPELAGVLGHSFGGKLAAWSWLGTEKSFFPPVETSLFLLSPSGIMNELSPSRRALQFTLQAIPRSLKRNVFGSVRKFVYNRLLNETDYISATSFQESTLSLILQQDIREVASPSEHSLRLCWGERDPAVPSWMAYEFSTLSSDAEIFLVPNCGHFPHHEKTEFVLRWLKANDL